MKTLIIGASGFVGHHLIERLAIEGWSAEATCLPAEKLEADIPVYKLDILNQQDIEEVLSSSKPDAIVHLAAQSSVSVSWSEPALTIDINIKGAVNLLEAVRKTRNSARVLLIGSGEQYGFVPEDHMPINEDEPQNPGNIYAVTKYTQDMLGALYVKSYGMDIVRVRAFNHIGPGQSPIFVISDFCRQVALLEKNNGASVMKVGNLAAKRDFTDVRDVVRAYILLCEKGQKGEFYNVGSGSAVSIKELLDKILSHSRKKISVETDHEKFRPIDLPIIEADISKLVKDTGWRPEHKLDDTILETLNYWRSMC